MTGQDRETNVGFSAIRTINGKGAANLELDQDDIPDGDIYGRVTHDQITDLDELISNGENIAGHVNTFADLPDVATNVGLKYIVDSGTGIWGINRKPAGTYLSTGTIWTSSYNAVDVINSLTSTQTQKALSANQGLILEAGRVANLRAVGDLSSVGFLGQVTLTVNGGDNTKYDASCEDAVLVDHSIGATTPLAYLGPLSFVAQPTPYLATSPVTYVGLNNLSALETRNRPFTVDEHRTIIPIGPIRHINLTTIDGATPQPMMAQDVGMLLNDLLLGLGAFNVKGNALEANGVATDLSFKRTAGDAFQVSGNHEAEIGDPNFIHTTEVLGASYFSNYLDATSGVVVTLETQLDPNFWDDRAGTLNALQTGRVVAHRYTLFPSAGSVVIQYGQAQYANMAGAEAGYLTEPFEERNDLAAGIFMGWLLLTQGTTNFGSALLGGTAKFIEADKFQLPQRFFP